ncbi:hypothetical protein ABZX88_03700 [Kitasatospora aureofaciens]|uniref:hypothetical protein n=1 Tax=Kitasatospora aureofaciens TaxID=1894 RepID=UPI000525F6F9|nr:hypothetical protein [Kitasatospora aureofaciens]HJD84654.1 hypothetical protein [Kitasatospora aureofaciens]
MSTGTLIAIIVPVVVVLILAAVVLWYVNRRRRLQQRFGPEYERAVDRTGSHRAAERDLRQREQRHDQLQITPLPPGARQRYTEDWKRVQQEFVDRPGEAVQHADRLVTLLMHDRGYPTEGYEQQLRDLSVEHGRTLEHYRAAHATNASARRDDATTEELRGAMVHYRALFAELLNGDEPPGRDSGAGRR